MEYALLTWMSSTHCHLNLLDKVQRPVECLISRVHLPRQYQQQHEQQMDAAKPLWDSLEHHRNVAALTHAAQVTGTTHAIPDGSKGHLEEV